MITLGILIADTGPEALQERHGTFADLFIRLLGATEVTFAYRSYRVIDGEFPVSTDECDAWLITGSVHGVYDKLTWINPLKALICTLHDQKRPLVGICFGHQIIAEALGARVEKFQGGWNLGPKQYRVLENLSCFGEDIEHFSINAIHQDQVLSCPPGARVFATAPCCLYAGLIWGKHILTLQGHPEFYCEYERDLLTTDLGVSFPEQELATALETLEALENRRLENNEPEDKTPENKAFIGHTLDDLRVGQWIARFFRQAATDNTDNKETFMM